MPGKVPSPTRIFHISSLRNLPAILASGCLRSKNGLAAQNVGYTNIAYANIQARRAEQQVTCGPGGLVHDYVPFYFAPRSPMLLAVHTGKVPGYSNGQSEIVHFETTAEAVRDSGAKFAFYDMHSSVAIARAYDDLSQLDQVAWDLITETPSLDGYCKYWHSDINNSKYARRKEFRQAEFLVHESLHLSLVTRIGVCNKQAEQQVISSLGANPVKLRVEVRSEWYY